MAAVTHLLITKFILKLAGICGLCNFNICCRGRVVTTRGGSVGLSRVNPGRATPSEYSVV
jgi:hypothetical protein